MMSASGKHAGQPRPAEGHRLDAVHVGLCLYVYRDLERTRQQHARLLQMKDESGLEAVEPHLTDCDYRIMAWEFTPEHLELWRKFLAHFRSAGAHLPFPWGEGNLRHVRTAADREYNLERIAYTIRFSAELGLRYGVLHPTGLFVPEAEEGEEQLREALARLAEVAGQEGFLLGLENGDAELGRLVGRARAVGSPWLGLTLDVGHAAAQSAGGYGGYANLEDFIRRESELLVCLHLHDYDGRSDHLPLGRGKVDWAGLAHALREADFRGNANLA